MRHLRDQVKTNLKTSYDPLLKCMVFSATSQGVVRTCRIQPFPTCCLSSIHGFTACMWITSGKKREYIMMSHFIPSDFLLLPIMQPTCVGSSYTSVHNFREISGHIRKQTRKLTPTGLPKLLEDAVLK